MSVISEQYALAFFALAHETGVVPSALDTLQMCVPLVQEHKAFFEHPKVAKKAKLETFEKAIGPGLIRDFLGVLITNNRLNHLTAIVEELKALVAAQDQEMVLEVTSAKPLSTERLEQIKQQFETEYRRRVVIETIVDENQIGGLRYAFDGKVLNDTVTQNLNTLKHRLMK
jgi:F-type H+-transporting ATPase subunit delta